MANTYSPFGFREFGRLEGSAPTWGLTRSFILSSDTVAVFTGDVVQNSTAVYGYVTQASTGTATTGGYAGVFMGCEYYSPSVGRVVWSPYFPGTVSSSNPVIAYLKTDPNTTFICQGSTAAILGSSVIGWNIGFTSTNASNGNTTTGISAVGLLSSSVGANSSLPFRIVDVYSNNAPPGTNGTDNTVAGAVMVVVPNNWARNTTTGVST